MFLEPRFFLLKAGDFTRFFIMFSEIHTWLLIISPAMTNLYQELYIDFIVILMYMLCVDKD